MLIEPKVASPLTLIEEVILIEPPDKSSIVFVFTAPEPVAVIFPPVEIPLLPTVNPLDMVTSAGKPTTIVSVA